jgi:hypothetical protein
MARRKMLGALVAVDFFVLPRGHMPVVAMDLHRYWPNDHAALGSEQKGWNGQNKGGFLNERFHNTNVLGLYVEGMYYRNIPRTRTLGFDRFNGQAIPSRKIFD